MLSSMVLIHILLCSISLKLLTASSIIDTLCSKEAKSLSLYKLVQHVKEVIDSKFGVRLEEEIIFIGNFDL